MNLQLQVTGLEGAEGKDQIVFLNSGEVKRDLMGSLAGPESPNPCSQRTKLRAIESGFGFNFKEEGCCWFEWDSSTNQMVLLRVIASTAIGFANSTSFISSAPSCSPFCSDFLQIWEPDFENTLLPLFLSENGSRIATHFKTYLFMKLRLNCNQPTIS
jgi:hypothetical protein